MSSFGTIPLNEIWAMLEHCAPGFTKREGLHKWAVMYNGRTYPSLPKGEHGRRANPPIEIGHVKTMCRHLGVLECAKSRLQQL